MMVLQISSVWLSLFSIRIQVTLDKVEWNWEFILEVLYLAMLYREDGCQCLRIYMENDSLDLIVLRYGSMAYEVGFCWI